MFSSYNPPTISSIYIEGLEISAKDAEAAAIAARDAAQAARDDALQYRNETHTYYTQVQQIQTGDYVTTQSLNDALSAFSFSDLASVPTSFTPSAHSHAWGDISGKPSAFTPAYHTHLWAHITDKPTEFEPAEHVHTWQQIAQKPGTFPPESHYHNWSEIEGKPSAFNPAAHTHSWGDISGKPNKFEPVVHTHDWSAIDNKPLAFPPESHAHHWDTVTNKPAQATRWPTFAEVTGKPAQATRWPKYSEVTEKPTLGSAAARNVGKGAGELLEVGSFGLGGLAETVTDANKELESGIYSGSGSTGLNFPGGMAYGVFFNAVRANNNAVNGRLYIGDVSGEARAYIGFSNNNGQSFDNQELFHTGNSVNPTNYGLGVQGDDIAPAVGSYDGNKRSGIFKTNGGESGTPFDSGIASVINMKRGSRNAVNQLYVRGDEVKNEAQMYFRGGAGENFSDWFKLYHSGNADFEKFGGGDSGEKLVSGFAKFSNYAVFEAKLSFVTSARNIEVSGTFKIIDKVNGNTIIDGINGLSLSGDSSNKEGLIVFNAGASLFTKGQELELLSSTSGAYFKVGA